MIAVCARCSIEYSLEDYEESRFCRKCGSILKLQTEPRKATEKTDGRVFLDNNFEYDIPLAKSIGEILHEQFQNKTGYFEGHVMPEYIKPPIAEGSRELALYYTYIISVDYQTDAHKLWMNSRERYNEKPDIFEPETILSTPDEELTGFIKSLGARYPNSGSGA